MSSADEPVLCTSSGGVATITLNRPQALNAITSEMLTLLGEVLGRVREDPDVVVVVLTGTGRAFSAGVDLKALGGRSLENGAVGDFLDGPARKAIQHLVSMDKVVIAKVNGPCFTGALELALACDLMVVAESAKMGDTHAKFGLRPTWGMSQRLVRAVGITRARDLSFTARTFTGRDAAEWGLATVSVPVEELDRTVEELVASVLANSCGSLAAYKDLYRKSLDGGLTEGLAYEAATPYPIADSNERVAGFR